MTTPVNIDNSYSGDPFYGSSNGFYQLNSNNILGSTFVKENKRNNNQNKFSPVRFKQNFFNTIMQKNQSFNNLNKRNDNLETESFVEDKSGNHTFTKTRKKPQSAVCDEEPNHVDDYVENEDPELVEDDAKKGSIMNMFDFQSKGVLERIMYIQRAFKRMYLVRFYTAEFLQKHIRAYLTRRHLKKFVKELEVFNKGLKILNSIICPKYYAKFFFLLGPFRSQVFVIRFVTKIQRFYKSKKILKRIRQEAVKPKVTLQAFNYPSKIIKKDKYKINNVIQSSAKKIQKAYLRYIISKYKELALNPRLKPNENNKSCLKFNDSTIITPRVENKFDTDIASTMIGIENTPFNTINEKNMKTITTSSHCVNRFNIEVVNEKVAKKSRRIDLAIRSFSESAIAKKVVFNNKNRIVTKAANMIKRNLKEYLKSKYEVVRLDKETFSRFSKLNNVFNNESNKIDTPFLGEDGRIEEDELQDASEIVEEEESQKNQSEDPDREEFDAKREGEQEEEDDDEKSERLQIGIEENEEKDDEEKSENNENEENSERVNIIEENKEEEEMNKTKSELAEEVKKDDIVEEIEEKDEKSQSNIIERSRIYEEGEDDEEKENHSDQVAKDEKSINSEINGVKEGDKEEEEEEVNKNGFEKNERGENEKSETSVIYEEQNQADNNSIEKAGEQILDNQENENYEEDKEDKEENNLFEEEQSKIEEVDEPEQESVGDNEEETIQQEQRTNTIESQSHTLHLKKNEILINNILQNSLVRKKRLVNPQEFLSVTSFEKIIVDHSQQSKIKYLQAFALEKKIIQENNQEEEPEEEREKDQEDEVEEREEDQIIEEEVEEREEDRKEDKIEEEEVEEKIEEGREENQIEEVEEREEEREENQIEEVEDNNEEEEVTIKEKEEQEDQVERGVEEKEVEEEEDAIEEKEEEQERSDDHIQEEGSEAMNDDIASQASLDREDNESQTDKISEQAIISQKENIPTELIKPKSLPQINPPVLNKVTKENPDKLLNKETRKIIRLFLSSGNFMIEQSKEYSDDPLQLLEEETSKKERNYKIVRKIQSVRNKKSVYNLKDLGLTEIQEEEEEIEEFTLKTKQQTYQKGSIFHKTITDSSLLKKVITMQRFLIGPNFNHPQKHYEMQTFMENIEGLHKDPQILTLNHNEMTMKKQNTKKMLIQSGLKMTKPKLNYVMSYEKRISKKNFLSHQVLKLGKLIKSFKMFLSRKKEMAMKIREKPTIYTCNKDSESSNPIIEDNQGPQKLRIQKSNQIHGISLFTKTASDSILINRINLISKVFLYGKPKEHEVENTITNRRQTMIIPKHKFLTKSEFTKASYTTYKSVKQGPKLPKFYAKRISSILLAKRFKKAISIMNQEDKEIQVHMSEYSKKEKKDLEEPIMIKRRLVINKKEILKRFENNSKMVNVDRSLLNPRPLNSRQDLTNQLKEELKAEYKETKEEGVGPTPREEEQTPKIRQLSFTQKDGVCITKSTIQEKKTKYAKKQALIVINLIRRFYDSIHSVNPLTNCKYSKKLLKRTQIMDQMANSQPKIKIEGESKEDNRRTLINDVFRKSFSIKRFLNKKVYLIQKAYKRFKLRRSMRKSVCLIKRDVLLNDYDNMSIAASTRRGLNEDFNPDAKEFFFHNMFNKVQRKQGKRLFNSKALMITSFLRKSAKILKMKKVITKIESLLLPLKEPFALWYGKSLQLKKATLFEKKLNGLQERLVKGEICAEDGLLSYQLRLIRQLNKLVGITKENKGVLKLYMKAWRMNSKKIAGYETFIRKIEKLLNSSEKRRVFRKLNDKVQERKNKENLVNGLSKIEQSFSSSQSRFYKHRLFNFFDFLQKEEDLKEFTSTEAFAISKEEGEIPNEYKFCDTYQKQKQNQSSFVLNSTVFKEIVIKSAIMRSFLPRIQRDCLRAILNASSFSKFLDLTQKGETQLLFAKPLSENKEIIRSILDKYSKTKKIVRIIFHQQFRSFIKALSNKAHPQDHDSHHLHTIQIKMQEHSHEEKKQDLDFFSNYTKKTDKSKKRAEKIDNIYESFSKTLASPRSEKHEEIEIHDKQEPLITQSMFSDGEGDMSKKASQTFIGNRNHLISPIKEEPRMSVKAGFEKEAYKSFAGNKAVDNVLESYDVDDSEVLGMEPRMPKPSVLTLGASKKKRGLSKKKNNMVKMRFMG